MNREEITQVIRKWLENRAMFADYASPLELALQAITGILSPYADYPGHQEDLDKFMNAMEGIYWLKESNVISYSGYVLEQGEPWNFQNELGICK
jgi:hypothetical protein